jgi:nucleotide-binding universal stress UspA family protein
MRPSRSDLGDGKVRGMHGTIVCGVVDTAEGRAAAQLAGALAARLGLRLVLVHAVADQGSAWERDDATTESFLDTIDRSDSVETRIVSGNRVDALARVAAEEGADVIVLGSRARGARGRQLRCSLARELEAAQAVPVLIAPPATRERGRRRLSLAEAAAGR